MKTSGDRLTIEALAVRINTLLSRQRRAQAIGDAGLKRVIDEELAEARTQYQQLSRVGDSIVDTALITPATHRTRRRLV